MKKKKRENFSFTSKGAQASRRISGREEEIQTLFSLLGTEKMEVTASRRN
jgi:hypothetical protein